MIEVIDCDYTMPRYAAAYLLVKDGRAAFIDNNTAHAVPKMLAALEARGLTPAAVDYCIITHVHLDHAGGSSALMAACPDATLIAHPRAARHAIDPSKLVASASAVYGEEQFRELYGVIDPIPEKRVRTMDDGEQLEFAGTPLRFTHTRGHANHHFVIYDPDEKAIFTGDAFGLCYPDLCRDGLFALPSTSPTDFDGPLARDAVQVILETGAETAYPTHFGPVREMEEMARQVTAHLERSEALMLEAKASDLPDDQLEGWIRPRLDAHFAAALGDTDTARDPQTWKRLEMDLALNAQGLAFVAAKKRRKEAEASSS